MPTIGEDYNPIIAARNDPVLFEKLLRETGKEIFKVNPDICSNEEDGYQAAKRNLNYYVQYFDDKTVLEVKKLLGSGNS
jgi:hypothetical protein